MTTTNVDLPVPDEARDFLRSLVEGAHRGDEGAVEVPLSSVQDTAVRVIARPVVAELFSDEDALVDVITTAWVEDGYPDAEDMGPVALVAVQALARRFGVKP